MAPRCTPGLAAFEQHFLNLLPLPHGHGSFLPVFIWELSLSRDAGSCLIDGPRPLWRASVFSPSRKSNDLTTSALAALRLFAPQSTSDQELLNAAVMITMPQRIRPQLGPKLICRQTTESEPTAATSPSRPDPASGAGGRGRRSRSGRGRGAGSRLRGSGRRPGGARRGTAALGTR